MTYPTWLQDALDDVGNTTSCAEATCMETTANVMVAVAHAVGSFGVTPRDLLTYARQLEDGARETR